MASLLNGNVSGFGYRFGDGFGNGDGNGSGVGGGDRFGSGDGDGFGFGDEFGGGSGDGSGSGDGFGDGDGSGPGFGDDEGFGDGSGSAFEDGDGSSVVIGQVSDYSVLSRAPWPYLQVGCEVHPIPYWQEHWRELAQPHGVEISSEDVTRLLARALDRLAG